MMKDGHINNDGDEDDEELNNASARLIREPKRDEALDIPFCGCLSVKFYQPYFDVDTEDVLKRMSNTVFFCNREENFLALISEKPDAYGPVWIATTLVFTVAVTSNISGWLTHWMVGKVWSYDFQSVVTLSSIVYGFAGGAPVAIWFLFRQIEAQVPLMNVFCLYGYSLAIFIPAALVCILPNEALSWLALIGAAGCSGLFLLRNLAPIIVSHARQHALLLLGLIGSIQLAFTLSMKIFFLFSP